MAKKRIGAYSEETARMVLEAVQSLRNQGLLNPSPGVSPPVVRGLHGVIAYTPAGGIAGRTGTTPGKAVCQCYRINSADQIVAIKDNANADKFVDVYNIAAGAVLGNVYIQAKWSYGRWIADAEDCT